VKYLEIAEQAWALRPQMIVPSGSIFSKATVMDLHEFDFYAYEQSLEGRQAPQPGKFPSGMCLSGKSFAYLPTYAGLAQDLLSDGHTHCQLVWWNVIESRVHVSLMRGG
jgi:hypothetical protein